MEVDYEFHFSHGDALYATLTEERDTVQMDAHTIVLTVNTPGQRDEIVVQRAKLNGLRITRRTIEPSVTLEDAGKLKVIGTPP